MDLWKYISSRRGRKISKRERDLTLQRKTIDEQVLAWCEDMTELEKEGEKTRRKQYGSVNKDAHGGSSVPAGEGERMMTESNTASG